MSTRTKLFLLLSVAVVLALLVGFASLSVEVAYRGSRAPTTYAYEQQLGEGGEEEKTTTRGFLVVPLLGLMSIWMSATLMCAILAVILIVALKAYEKKKGPPSPGL